MDEWSSQGSVEAAGAAEVRVQDPGVEGRVVAKAEAEAVARPASWLTLELETVMEG